MGSVLKEEQKGRLGIPDQGEPLHFQMLIPGNPGEKTSVVLGVFSAMAYETNGSGLC